MPFVISLTQMFNLPFITKLKRNLNRKTSFLRCGYSTADDLTARQQPFKTPFVINLRNKKVVSSITTI